MRKKEKDLQREFEKILRYHGCVVLHPEKEGRSMSDAIVAMADFPAFFVEYKRDGKFYGMSEGQRIVADRLVRGGHLYVLIDFARVMERITVSSIDRFLQALVGVGIRGTYVVEEQWHSLYRIDLDD